MSPAKDLVQWGDFLSSPVLGSSGLPVLSKRRPPRHNPVLIHCGWAKGHRQCGGQVVRQWPLPGRAPVQKLNLGPNLTTCVTTMHTSWLLPNTVSAKQEDNIRQNLDDPRYADHIAETMPKPRPTKEAIAKLYFIETENVCHVKDNGKRMKNQETGWD